MPQALADHKLLVVLSLAYFPWRVETEKGWSLGLGWLCTPDVLCSCRCFFSIVILLFWLLLLLLHLHGGTWDSLGHVQSCSLWQKSQILCLCIGHHSQSPVSNWNTMSAEMFLQCFNGILGSKVIEFSYFNVLGEIINQYQVMMTFKGEDVWSSHCLWQIRDRTWHQGLFLLCRRVVVAHGTVFYFVFYLSAHSRPIKRFPGPLFALHNSKVCSVY